MLGIAKTRGLPQTWEELPKKDLFNFLALEISVVQPSLKQSTSEKAIEYRASYTQQPPPKIPHLELALQDLLQIEQQERDDRSVNKLINFQKRRSIYDVISGLLQAQQDPYIFMEVFQIKQFLAKFPRVDAKTLQRALTAES